MKTYYAEDYSSEKIMPVTRVMGFTLIELMIVVAIISILSAIAYPSYVSYITKSRRVAAEGCLSQYANYMERFYTTNLAYTPNTNTTLPTLDCATTQQTGAYYQYSFPAAVTSSAYIVQAVPLVPQSTRDTTCGTLTLNQAGARTAASSTGCW